MATTLIGDSQITRGRAVTIALRKLNIPSQLVTTSEELQRQLLNPEITLAVLDPCFAPSLNSQHSPPRVASQLVKFVFWHFGHASATSLAVAQTLGTQVLLRPTTLSDQIRLLQTLHSENKKDAAYANLDFSVVIELRECCSSLADFRRLVENFNRDALTLLESIITHRDTGDVDRMRSSLHQLRGGVASIGGRSLLNLLDKLETQANETLRHHDFKDADDALATCVAALRSFDY